MELRSAGRRKLGESYETLVGRLCPWLAALEGDAFVVSHGGVARAFMTILGGVPGQVAAGTPIEQGRALAFGDGRLGWID
jgi:broad specificity phosphatase PhoE